MKRSSKQPLKQSFQKISFLSVLVGLTVFSACTGGKKEEAPAPSPVIQSGPATVLHGKVTVTQALTDVKEIKMTADAGCVQANAGKKVLDDRILVGADKGLGNVFVRVVGASSPKKGSELQPVVLDQKGCMYAPHVLGIMTNQELTLKNSDPIMHNVNASATKNERFNTGMSGNQSITRKFSRPETMIKLKCDVHGWMSAYLGVVDHPYFSVTSESGTFEIPEVPGGSYEIEAWHEKFGTKTIKVSLEGGRKEVNFEF